MHDRAMPALSRLALEPSAETLAAPNAYGFRTGRSTADAIGPCDLMLPKPHAPAWRLEGDIQTCFDRISHAGLLTPVPLDKAMLHTWLQAGSMERHVFHPPDRGTPQGGPVSPVLANLAFEGLERCLQQAYPQTGRGRHAKSNLVR